VKDEATKIRIERQTSSVPLPAGKGNSFGFDPVGQFCPPKIKIRLRCVYSKVRLEGEKGSPAVRQRKSGGEDAKARSSYGLVEEERLADVFNFGDGALEVEGLGEDDFEDLKGQRGRSRLVEDNSPSAR
jgi:hypothetical protein